MIIGIGTDLVNQNRIARIFYKFKSQFIKKILNKSEINSLFQINTNQICSSNDSQQSSNNSDQTINFPYACSEINHISDHTIIKFLAKKFAATEAISKALGCGIGSYCKFHDITLSKNQHGKPEISMHNDTKQFADKLGIKKIFITFSDEKLECSHCKIHQNQSQQCSTQHITDQITTKRAHHTNEQFTNLQPNHAKFCEQNMKFDRNNLIVICNIILTS